MFFFSICPTGAYARLKKTFHEQKSNRWLMATKKLQTNKGGDASLISKMLKKRRQHMSGLFLIYRSLNILRIVNIQIKHA